MAILENTVTLVDIEKVDMGGVVKDMDTDTAAVVVAEQADSIEVLASYAAIGWER